MAEAVTVTVGTTATRLDDANASGGETLILRDATGDMFIGGSGVTTADGFPVKAADTTPITVPVDSDGVYGIVAAATQTVKVLRIVG